MTRKKYYNPSTPEPWIEGPHSRCSILSDPEIVKRQLKGNYNCYESLVSHEVGIKYLDSYKQQLIQSFGAKLKEIE